VPPLVTVSVSTTPAPTFPQVPVWHVEQLSSQG
jgi:hypothetical protein